MTSRVTFTTCRPDFSTARCTEPSPCGGAFHVRLTSSISATPASSTSSDVIAPRCTTPSTHADALVACVVPSTSTAAEMFIESANGTLLAPQNALVLKPRPVALNGSGTSPAPRKLTRYTTPPGASVSEYAFSTQTSSSAAASMVLSAAVTSAASASHARQSVGTPAYVRRYA